ncbi:putative DNA-invertase from lambdoid prophage Rac [Hyphomicrobium sp. 1Nfss2.1]|uniref:recombinase family protein n=1 Tax=Hyphomicrobium sp. 1Nfss2.1 TaxID=3413936 RepID=UPI003C7DA4CE
MAKVMRVAIYVRVSTGGQTVENQLRELKAWTERAGHQVVRVFEDNGISGAKGRDKRPGLDAMLKAATRREFDLVAVWSSDRLGRSLKDLLETLKSLNETGRQLYIHTQALDTSTATGRMLFQMLGVFAEFEREVIVTRVNAGLARARAEGKRLGRPRKGDASEDTIRAQLSKGTGILKTAKLLNCGTSTVHKVARAMRAETAAA